MAPPEGDAKDIPAMTSPDLAALRDEILLSTLGNIAFDGWTERSLRDGASMAGQDADTARLAFPDGIPGLIAHFADWADRQMAEAAAAEGPDFATRTLRDRLVLVVRARFLALAPHHEAVRRLPPVLALPANAPRAAGFLVRSADAAWRAAGDDATDFSYYLRRAALVALLSAATAYWLGDRSEGHRGTLAFIERRIDRMLAVGRLADTVGQGLGGLAELPWRLAGSVRQRAARRS